MDDFVKAVYEGNFVMKRGISSSTEERSPLPERVNAIPIVLPSDGLEVEPNQPQRAQ